MFFCVGVEVHMLLFFSIDSSVFVLISQLKRRRHQQSAASIDGGMSLWAHKYLATILQLTQKKEEVYKYISLYIIIIN